MKEQVIITCPRMHLRSCLKLYTGNWLLIRKTVPARILKQKAGQQMLPTGKHKQLLQQWKEENVCCVEMEASALYAFAEAKQKNVTCFAHLTNTMAQTEGDFEKGNTLEVLIR